MGSSSPIFGMNIKNIWVATTQIGVFSGDVDCKPLLHGWCFQAIWRIWACQFGSFPQGSGVEISKICELPPPIVNLASATEHGRVTNR